MKKWCGEDDKYQKARMGDLLEKLEPVREKINQLTLKMVKYDGHLCNQSTIWRLDLPVNNGKLRLKV